VGHLEEALARLRVAVDEVLGAALRDDKSPLMNRPAMLRFGEQLVEGVGLGPAGTEADVEDIAGVVAYGDINDFKAFNSRHGHDVADLALYAVGVQLNAVAELCRGRAFRPSGDEFVLLLPAASIDLAVAEIASRLGHCEVDLRGSIDVVAMSFGFTRTSDVTLTELLRRAERACESAKRSGPGCVVEWLPEMDDAEPVSTRARCGSCGTIVSLTIPSGRRAPTPSVCPICAGALKL
jgi:diguanylate cyclase (GGDEF)-like protein